MAVRFHPTAFLGKLFSANCFIPLLSSGRITCAQRSRTKRCRPAKTGGSSSDAPQYPRRALYPHEAAVPVVSPAVRYTDRDGRSCWSNPRTKLTHPTDMSSFIPFACPQCGRQVKRTFSQLRGGELEHLKCRKCKYVPCESDVWQQLCRLFDKPQLNKPQPSESGSRWVA
jgi:hypothetical protein